MENVHEITPSKESESSFSPIIFITPTQPENVPKSTLNDSGPSDSSDIRDQSQSQSDTLPISVDGDDCDATHDEKKRKMSIVWNHFKKKIINGEEKAICNYCNKQLTAILLREQKKVDGSSTYLSNYHFDLEQSRRDLASMIIIHEYPLSIVDHLGFRAYFEGLQPLFKVLSRNTIKGDIIKIYLNEKLKTMGLLEKIGSRIALTTDMWPSQFQSLLQISIGITGPKQYVNLKDKRLQSFGESDSDEEVLQSDNTGI
ncbi:zinc finger BED domain-containing protein RICESLEEPER 3-like [Abrus precatorius]|uniref:Zinc finger BED domain-containing protein RICESLEEPER 3-like n=1 Tax=Abrus precatorius TaxID=3816 RepID=A0A8B8K305_ABRPR|nr:zinc finger BED domain-containing protein RICESLEEPER 3-like [Abrus precatorius]